MLLTREDIEARERGMLAPYRMASGDTHDAFTAKKSIPAGMTDRYAISEHRKLLDPEARV
jgi:dGTP triphosphohydrolase